MAHARDSRVCSENLSIRAKSKKVYGRDKKSFGLNQIVPGWFVGSPVRCVCVCVCAWKKLWA